MLNSPISGIQNLYKYDDEIKNQIIFVENYEQGKFINIIEYIKNKNVYDKDIEEKDIYLLNENYIPVNIYFNNGNEWNGFYSFNDELYYNIGKDWLWKFHLTIAST